jgi:hypothetical protein
MQQMESLVHNELMFVAGVLRNFEHRIIYYLQPPNTLSLALFTECQSRVVNTPDSYTDVLRSNLGPETGYPD